MTDVVKMAIAEQAANLTVPEDGKFGGPCTYKRLWYIARDAALAALEQGDDDEHSDECGCMLCRTEAHHALEQAGEPVAGENSEVLAVLAFAKARSWHHFGVAWDKLEKVSQDELVEQSAAFLIAPAPEAPLPTLQRLGQEFDAGEVAIRYDQTILDHRFEVPYFQYCQTPAWAGSCKCGHIVFAESSGEVLRQWAKHVSEAITALAHPPQSRGQAFDGEGEARTYHADDCEAMLRPRADCTCTPMIVTPGADAEMRKLLDLIETADEHGDECAIVEQAAAVRAALSSAKRGEG